MTDYNFYIDFNYPVYEAGGLVVEFGTYDYSFTDESVGKMSCVSSRRTGCVIQLVSSNKLKFTNIFLDQITSLQITLKYIQNPYKLGPTTPLTLSSYKVVSGQ